MYNLIGHLLIWVLIVSVIFSVLALFMSKTSVKRHVHLAGFFSSILDFFYLPLKYLFCKFSDPRILDTWMVSLKNIAHNGSFLESSKRIMFVPHCMRSLDCPAPSTRLGIQCINCGKCDVGKLKEKAESEGYDFFIVTGSSFVERILRGQKTDGVFVVACNYEINKGMRSLRSTNIPIVGFSLLNDGCFNTCLNYDEMLIKIQDFKTSPNVCE